MLDFWSGRLSWRKFGSFLDGLPAESLTMTALRNEAPEPVIVPGAPVSEHEPEKDPWSHAEMLLAQLIDDVRLLRWTTVAVQAHAKPPAAPEPMRRPGYKGRRGRRGMTREQAARIDPRLRVVPDPTAS